MHHGVIFYTSGHWYFRNQSRVSRYNNDAWNTRLTQKRLCLTIGKMQDMPRKCAPENCRPVHGYIPQGTWLEFCNHDCHVTLVALECLCLMLKASSMGFGHRSPQRTPDYAWDHTENPTNYSTYWAWNSHVFFVLRIYKNLIHSINTWVLQGHCVFCNIVGSTAIVLI